MKAHFSQMHWGQILLASVLVIILAIILDLVWLLLTVHLWGIPPQAEPIYQVIPWGKSVVAILLTAGGAVWVARRGERGAPLHGLLVGLVAALVLLILSPDITNFFQGAYHGRLDLLARALVTFVLIVASGWLGGILGSRAR